MRIIAQHIFDKIRAHSSWSAESLARDLESDKP